MCLESSCFPEPLAARWSPCSDLGGVRESAEQGFREGADRGCVSRRCPRWLSPSHSPWPVQLRLLNSRSHPGPGAGLEHASPGLGQGQKVRRSSDRFACGAAILLYKFILCEGKISFVLFKPLLFGGLLLYVVDSNPKIVMFEIGFLSNRHCFLWLYSFLFH